MTRKPYSIRLMNREGLQIAIAWAAAEGWNPGWHDAECFYAADPTGFWIGLLGDEPIATISAIKYGDSFGFVGFYNVAAVNLAEKYQMKKVFETARMYTEASPELPYDRLFGVTTFELG